MSVDHTWCLPYGQDQLCGQPHKAEQTEPVTKCVVWGAINPASRVAEAIRVSAIAAFVTV